MSEHKATERRPARPWGTVAFGVAVLVAVAWFTGAIYFQVEPSSRAVWLAAPALLAIGIVAVRLRKPRAGWLALLAVLIAGALWWSSIRPSDTRDWAPDVRRGVTAEIGPRDVVVHGIRSFDWITEDKAAAESWKTERYDPDTITSLDLLTSVWDSPAIAHTILTFGFADGRRLAFSAETRRERTEEFSTFGGFFKKFELVLLAAEEADIIRLRTNLRKEQVSLYPIAAAPENMKALFLSYLAAGNALARKPEFYNTVTANCTTVIWELARHTGAGVPLDWRVLVSGYLPDYLYERGTISSTLSLPAFREAAAISRLGQSVGPGQDYSAVIRSGPLYRK